MLSITPLPILSDNYAYLLRCAESGVVAIVDPAEEAPCIAAIEAAGGRLDLILLTHHHGDHIAAAEPLRAKYGAKIVGAKADAHRLPRLDQAVVEGDAVQIGNVAAQVFDTPGHTRGHIAFYLPAASALFCGDTLFALGCGRFLEGTADEMFASLAKFAALPGETLVYCGHEYTESNARFAVHADPGNAALAAYAEKVFAMRKRGAFTIPSRLSDEMACNPFLRALDAAALGGLREAKNQF
jgi:hydroxyacylglutathione hydrolase